MTRFLLVFLLVGVVAGGEASAQGVLGNADQFGGAYYRFAKASDTVIEVKVWGAVNNPGFYEVSRDLRLSTLLSLAGGPDQVGRVSDARRTLMLRLFRPTPGGGPAEIVFETQMEDRLMPFDTDPTLLSGDVLVVEEQLRRRFGWRDGLSVVTVLGTLALVIDRVINLTD